MMAAAGLPEPAVLGFALSMAYDERGIKSFSRSRWRNIAYLVRYGKGINLREALSLDVNSMGDLMEALSYCINQESKASKVKKR